MRKIVATIAFACIGLFALAACNKGGDAAKQQEQAAAAAPAAALPTDPTDKNAWKKYLVGVVTANMQGVKTRTPYMYFVPAGDDEAAVADRDNQLANVQTVVARGVLPGNMMAFGGPDSNQTATLIADAFKDANPGSFKGVVVLFIGAAADADRVKQVLVPSTAEFRFVEMK
jgi:hypothetical protein